MSISSINTSFQANTLIPSAVGVRSPALEESPAGKGSAAPPGTPSDSAAAALAGQQVTANSRVGDAEKPQDATAQPKPASLEEVQKAMEEVRNAIAPVAQELLFSIDDDTGRTIIKVMDSSTDEVIRQIPSEEIISIAKALDKLQGLLIEQKA